ncbi:ATP-binding protein [Streptomyces sp. NPDC059092]|uniref:ATP-binding protein n=1 Tax=Streptomyces sp. NPDC059092 TaxID=3346725 RepID=UPI00367AD7E9
MNHDAPMKQDDEQRDPQGQYVTFRLASHPRSVGRARHVLRARIGLAGDTGATAALLLSELVTNALRHGSPPGREIAVTLFRADGLFRVEVEDAGESLPSPRVPGADDECGRGLALVAALADDWGVAPRRGPGKRVWALLKVPGAGESGVSGGIVAGIEPGLSSGIVAGIAPGVSSGIAPGVSSGITAGVSSGIEAGVSSGATPGITPGTPPGVTPGDSMRDR